jgi:hypothetical protein
LFKLEFPAWYQFYELQSPIAEEELDFVALRQSVSVSDNVGEGLSDLLLQFHEPTFKEGLKFVVSERRALVRRHTRPEESVKPG